MHLSFTGFSKLAKTANVIPVFTEMNADLDTPVSAFLKIKKGGYSFLLESVEGQEKIARYSFLGSNPSLIFKSKGSKISLIYPQQKETRHFQTRTNPLDELRNLSRGFRAAQIKGLPRFYGGFVGFIGYDMVRFFEDIPDKNQGPLHIPDSVFILTDTLLIFDHLNHTIKIVSTVFLPKQKLGTAGLRRLYNLAVKRIDAVRDEFNRAVIASDEREKRGKRDLKIVSNLKKTEFSRIVLQAKKYIKRGDIIQVVLSQRFQARINRRPFDIYRSLRSLNPSPYMFYLKLGDVYLVGSSPEMLVRCEDGIVQTRPIAGTRPRGRNEEEDNKLQRELLRDAKEKAEHLMLVDLGRNDLGRISKRGQVKLTEFMNVERYSHVMHIVSEVQGILEKKYDAYDVLKACFPAGTVSGAPKIRAMEIIDELEPLRRQAYAGCVGYFSFSHNMDTCITIRTILVKDNTAYVQAGAGIVADSKPGREYDECVNKARALFEAIAR